MASGNKSYLWVFFEKKKSYHQTTIGYFLNNKFFPNANKINCFTAAAVSLINDYTAR